MNSTIENLNYIIYPLNKTVDKAIKLFEEAGLKLEKKTIKSVEDLNINMTKAICSSIEQV
jgi:hypothetical protein